MKLIPQQYRPWYRWVCFGSLLLGGLLTFCIRLAPAVAIPNLQATFALSTVELGLLTSLYLWPYALMQPLAGMLADGIGARRTVALFLAMAGAGQLLVALAPTLPVALVGRALTGIGASPLYVAAAGIMTHWFRRHEFGTLTGLWTSVANLGGITAAAPLAASITLMGWRASFGGIGLLTLATALLVWGLVRNSPTELGWPAPADAGVAPPADSAPQPQSLLQGVRIVLRTPNTWLLGAYAFLLFGTMTMMQGLWAVPFLMHVYDLTQQTAANYLTLWSVGLIVGCTLWGYVADHVVGTRKGVVLAGAAVYALLWVFLALNPAGLSRSMLWIAMFWGGFFASTWIPAYAQLRDSVPTRVVASAMGILNLFFWLGGAAYQQLSGVILAAFPLTAGRIPLSGYRTVFWLCLGSIGLSILLVACSKEPRGSRE